MHWVHGTLRVCSPSPHLRCEGEADYLATRACLDALLRVCMHWVHGTRGFWSASHSLGSLKRFAWILERELLARLTQASCLDSGARATGSAHSSFLLGFWSASCLLGSLKRFAWTLERELLARLTQASCLVPGARAVSSALGAQASSLALDTQACGLVPGARAVCSAPVDSIHMGI